MTTQTGTLIHGTLRDEDLIPVFLDVLSAAGEATFALATEWLFLSRNYVRRPGDGEWCLVRPTDPDLLDQKGELLVRLVDAIDAISAPGYYFGAHPGDGSDWGWWPVEFLSLS